MVVASLSIPDTIGYNRRRGIPPRHGNDPEQGGVYGSSSATERPATAPRRLDRRRPLRLPRATRISVRREYREEK